MENYDHVHEFLYSGKYPDNFTNDGDNFEVYGNMVSQIAVDIVVIHLFIFQG